ncbi:MAG: L-fucose isomerase [Candidatus Brocadiia bacterium]
MSAEARATARIGLMSFSDGRQRVHESLRPQIQEYQDRVEEMIRKAGAEPVVAEEIAWSPRRAVREAKRLLSQDIAAVVFNISVFSFPSFAALAARVLDKPVAILSAGEAGLPGMGGMLAAGGALHQMGMFEERIWGKFDSRDSQRKLETFIRGAAAAHGLEGQVYGQIGGRSIGMLTGVSSSPAEWLRIFGVDIDHADESEILRLAEEVDDAERARIVDWLESSVREVQYAEGTKLTRQNLEYQAATAAAVKRLAREREFDFVGIKCHFALSEYYCTQCLSAAFLPSLIDWDGRKAPMVCACEADGDGALTMQILQLISGFPALFLDLRHYEVESGYWVLCNCGGQSVYYSQRSDEPEENLKSVDLVPVIPKYGGVGAHVRYIGCEGEMTFARILHDDKEPSLIAFRGEAVPGQEAWLEKSCPAWPHIYASIDADHEELLTHLHANHVHAVAGDWMDELEMFARLTGIPFKAL